jgi:hypothetical protein
MAAFWAVCAKGACMDWFWQKKPVDLIEQCVADMEAMRPEPVELDAWAQVHQRMNDVLIAANGWCAPTEAIYDLPSIGVKRGGLTYDAPNANGKSAMRSVDALKMEPLWE